MTEDELAVSKTSVNSPGKQTEPRAPHSIRFSNDEWTEIERASEDRGMTAAELVRYAAVSFATGTMNPSSPPIPPETVAQIDRIYRGVYLLSTLKRDEMIRKGRHDDLDRIGQDARNSQIAIQEDTAKKTE
ncbi:MAG: hypothetical protein OXI11_01095 [Gammaproteobacteria bacterium]|nr:hypothetical protein [Gammaproteobacteria bacterium]